MIGIPAVQPSPTLADAAGLKQATYSGATKKKPLKGIKALAVKINIKKLPKFKKISPHGVKV